MAFCRKCLRGGRFDYCPECGDKLQQEVPFTGEPIGKSQFQITFPPVLGVYTDEEEILDRVRHSEFDDQTLPQPEIENVGTAVPPEDFPYICSKCDGYVSDNEKGRCYGCGEISWKKRDTDTSNY